MVIKDWGNWEEEDEVGMEAVGSWIEFVGHWVWRLRSELFWFDRVAGKGSNKFEKGSKRGE